MARTPAYWTNITKNVAHVCKWFLSCLSFRLLAALAHVVAASPPSALKLIKKTAKLLRLYEAERYFALE